MIHSYLLLKWLHILSSVVLVGTGFGSAFYLFFTHRTRNTVAIAEVVKLVVRADYWFTLPTIFIQPVTGLAMIWLAGMPLNQFWLLATFALYLLAGACWLPVVWLQIRMANIAQQAVAENQPLPQQYWRYARYWEYLGYPAFIAMLCVFALMVFKPV